MPNSIAISNMIGAGGNSTPTTSTVIDPISIKGGVIRNIDQATGDIARTTSGWIEDEKYGAYALADASAVSIEFDSAVTRTGRLTGYVKTTNATGKGRIVIGYEGGTGASLNPVILSKKGIPLKASTAYILSAYVKYNNIASLGGLIAVHEHGSNGTRLAANSLATVSGTSDWVLKTVSFTTNASTVWGLFTGGPAVAGDAQEFWIDINSMTLEEVSTITNSLSTPVQFYPKVTAVSSTDNIDQSQVVRDNTTRLGEVLIPWNAQQFTPTKNNLTGIIFRRGVDTGTYTGDVTISIQADSGSTTPSGTDLGTPVTILNADWANIADNTDYTVSYTLDLTVGGTYWVVFKSSTSDNSNYTRLGIQATGAYSGGVLKNYNGTAWTSALTANLYFKTLYSKNTTNFTVRTDTETLSVTAPTVDGWASGTAIDTTDGTYGITPLTLAAGDNTVYLSSNGSTLASSNTDESLQATLGGVYVG